MEVSCSKCPARYAVPDAKVRGRKVRIQCKRCKAPIVVDGSSIAEAAPKIDPPAAAPGAPKAPAPKAAGKQLEAPPRLRMDSGWREPGAVSAPLPKVPGAGPTARARAGMKRTMIGGLGGPGMDDEPETQVRPEPAPGVGRDPAAAKSRAAEALEPPAPPAPEPKPEPAPPPPPPPPPEPVSPAPPRVASPPRPTAAGAAPRPRAAIKKTMIGIPPPAAEAPIAPIAPMEAPEPEPPRPGTAAEWTVAITDDQHEELTTSEVIELYVRGGVDHETFIWAEGMEDWKQPWEIPLLAAELRQRGLVPPEEGEQIVPSSDFDDEDEHTVVAQGPPFSSRPSEQSGAWREPGGWGDLPDGTDGDIGFEDVTVSMEAPHAALLLRQTSELDDDDDDATIDADVDALLDGAEPAGTPYNGYDRVPSAPVDPAFADDSYDVTGRIVRPEPVAPYPGVAQAAHPPITEADILDFHAPGVPHQSHAEAPRAPQHAPPQVPSQPHHAPPQAPFEYPAHSAPGVDPRLLGQPQMGGAPGVVSQAPPKKKGGGGGIFLAVIVIILLISAVAVAYVTRQPPQLWDRLPI